MPVDVPVHVLKDSVVGIHNTDASALEVNLANVPQVTKQVLNEIFTRADAVLSDAGNSAELNAHVQKLNEHVQHLHDAVHHTLHTMCTIAVIAGIFAAILMIIITISLVVSAIALHKIAKQGEIELEEGR